MMSGWSDNVKMAKGRHQDDEDCERMTRKFVSLCNIRIRCNLHVVGVNIIVSSGEMRAVSAGYRLPKHAPENFPILFSS